MTPEHKAQRRTGLGSSDAAAACGRCPYRTALHVYEDKLGISADSDSEPKRWGRRLEAVVAAAYEEETGRFVQPPMELVKRHIVHPWLLASIDRYAWDTYGEPENLRVLECKTARTSHGWGEPGTDEIPEGYLIQVQHQLLVTGLPLADVAVLIGGSDFRVYSVQADERIHGSLLRIERDLWERILRRDPPPPDWTHADTPQLLDMLYRPLDGLTVQLSADLIGLADAYQHQGQTIRGLEDVRAGTKAALVEAMGAASVGLLPDGRRISRRIVAASEYTTTRGEYVSFRITKRRSDGYQDEA